MGYFVFCVVAHWGIENGTYQRATDLQLVLTEPDEREALLLAREYAPGRPEYVVRQIIHHAPQVERPEAFAPSWPVPSIRTVNGAAHGLLPAGNEG